MLHRLNPPAPAAHGPPAKRQLRPGARRAGTVGFTMTEMVVVSAILAILAALIIPGLFRARVMAARTACANNQKQLHAGLETFMLQHLRSPGDSRYDRHTMFMKHDYTPHGAEERHMATTPPPAAPDYEFNMLKTANAGFAIWEFLFDGRSGVVPDHNMYRCPSTRPDFFKDDYDPGDPDSNGKSNPLNNKSGRSDNDSTQARNYDFNDYAMMISYSLSYGVGADSHPSELVISDRHVAYWDDIGNTEWGERGMYRRLDAWWGANNLAEAYRDGRTAYPETSNHADGWNMAHRNGSVQFQSRDAVLSPLEPSDADDGKKWGAVANNWDNGRYDRVFVFEYADYQDGSTRREFNSESVRHDPDDWKTWNNWNTSTGGQAYVERAPARPLRVEVGATERLTLRTFFY